MKLISYLNAKQQPTYGAVRGDELIDLGSYFGPRAPDLKALIANSLVAEAGRVAKSAVSSGSFAKASLLPVIPNPGKIICVGLNYSEHVKETGRDLTENPALFIRVPSSQAAHNFPLIRPPESHKFDYEAEIALIIGKGGRRINEAASWDHIAGYACYNDGSVRDWQYHTTQWTSGKNYFQTGGFGPWMVTSDEIQPGQVLTVSSKINGTVMQKATTEQLIFSFPRLLNYISTVMPLEAGDVIVTGTPGGVGHKRTPPVYMKPGDVVEIEIDAVGVLRNTVADEVI